MEYSGGPDHDYGPDPAPTFAETVDDLVVKAHRFVMPLLILGIGIVLAWGFSTPPQ